MTRSWGGAGAKGTSDANVADIEAELVKEMILLNLVKHMLDYKLMHILMRHKGPIVFHIKLAME